MPSGVSIGQSSPHAVWCSWRGFGFFVSRATGVETLRSSASVAAEVTRESCWLTPFCVEPPPRAERMPQLPVASA